MASITIENVIKTFGVVQVLKGVSLEIKSGEFVVLVGPSGCGKSTLLRLIAGLESLTEGIIKIDGKVANDIPPRDRDLAMVFQSYALYPHMTVEKNLSYSLRLRKFAKDLINSTVMHSASLLGLADLLNRKPKQLSGGQRQRVAMGRAIVRKPKAFLFDEPLSNLDARLREQMRFEIRKLHFDLGATSIYVTHDQIEAMTMADRIVALNHGIIQQVGTPMELYDNPANLFVAEFIGSPAMNFIKGTVKKIVNSLTVCVDSNPLCDLPIGASYSIDAEVIIGLRPERIEITNNQTLFPAKIILIETTGLASIYHCDFFGQIVKIFTTSRIDFHVGEIAFINFDVKDIKLFDPLSGNRI